jgi:large subunit ribosomal protein L18
MAWKPTYNVNFRRRREGKTNYQKRLAALKSNQPRLVVGRSNKRVSAQVVQYVREGDKVIAGANSKHLAKYGWKAGLRNLPAAYLTGFLCGLKAKNENVTDVILDIGLLTPIKGSVPFAVLKGVVDAGLNVPHDPKAFPAEERLKAKHIADFAAKLGEDELKKKFSLYLKQGIDPKNLTELFEQTKAKISAGLEEKVKEA